MGQTITSFNCTVDILVDDALVAIFYYLSINDRLRVSSVCRRWNNVLADGRLWSRIDLWTKAVPKSKKPKSTTCVSQTKLWRSQDRLISKEESALAFLQRYAGPSLKIIYLTIVSKDILLHLWHKCKNVKVMSFLPDEDFSSPIICSHDLSSIFAETLFIPESIEKLQLTLKGMHLKSFEKRMLSDKLLRRIGECACLRHLHLNDFVLTPLGMMSLKKRTNLKELWLTDIHEDPEKLRVILSSIIDDLKYLTSFRLSVSKSYIGNIGEFIQHLTKKWTNLQDLGLKGGTLCSNNDFEDMTSRLAHLQSLELEGSIITNAIINIIASNLNTLTTLKLTNGYYTAKGIKYLVGHQSLQLLGLYQRQLTPSPLWLHAVYDVIASLPEIRNVNLVGNRLIELYVSEFYILKVIKSGVNIQISDSVLGGKRQSNVGGSDTVRDQRQSMPNMALIW